MANNLKAELEGRSFDGLGSMMESYALAAVDLAQKQFKQQLDFTADSIDALDEVLVRICDNPDSELEFEVKLWGSYLGEVLRRRYAGNWEMTPYPGGVASVPAVEVRGSRLFPMIKVYRRLTIGEEEDLRSFFAMVTERLGRPAQVN